MIAEAQAQGVSDIHVECQPGREKVKVRFRKDGQLRPYMELPHTYRAALIDRARDMGTQRAVRGRTGVDDERQRIRGEPRGAGGHEQAPQCRKLLLHAGFSEVQSWRDLAGIERVSGGSAPSL